MLLNKLIEKTAEKEVAQEEEPRYSPAEVIKIAAANLINFVAAVKEDGGHIKEASTEDEINHELIIKVAKLYVDNHYKEAGFNWLNIAKRLPGRGTSRLSRFFADVGRKATTLAPGAEQGAFKGLKGLSKYRNLYGTPKGFNVNWYK